MNKKIEKKNISFESISRYERKFFVQDTDKRDIEFLIKLNPSGFSEIFYERKVNSIYLDSENLDNYNDNVIGAQNRLKTRIRWYGDSIEKTDKPNLEIKIKTGSVGNKLLYPLTDFDTTYNLSDKIHNSISKSKVPLCYKIQTDLMKPTILISYDRKYFISADNMFRVTLDSNIKFYKVDSPYYNQNWGLDACIIELKYNYDCNDKAERITTYFPYRISRSSKYVMGLQKILGLSY